MWRRISYVGVPEGINSISPKIKSLILFNQVLFIGSFATLFQIAFVWPFIGNTALLFLGIFGSLLVCIYLNSKKRFNLSKWLYSIVIYSSAIITTILMGGDTLYHLQAVLVFTASLLMFNLQTDFWKITLGIPAALISIIIGETAIIHTPDFTGHYWTEIARIANITSLFAVETLLVLFVVRLNQSNENTLERALSHMTLQSKLLKENKLKLEEKVKERTQELEENYEVLAKQNDEKEVLLKEVHHRVRNNLQIIISLINLQIAKNDNETTEKSLKEIQGRVESMSLVHQKMYQNNNFKEVDLEEYLGLVINNMDKLYGDSDYQSELSVDKTIYASMDLAIPLGLIVNEITANFFKHVVPNTENPFMKLQISEDGNHLRIHYQDNGPGFLDLEEIENTDSLGMQLIFTLVDQIDGEVKVLNENGGQYNLTVPLP